MVSRTHPRVLLTLSLRGSGLGGDGVADRLADIIPATAQQQTSKFLATRLNVLRHVRDALVDIHINRNNKLVLKEEVVLNVMRSDTKFY